MEMASNGLHILNAPSATTTAVRSAISRMQMQSGPLSLVVIDYLQLLKDRTREEERLNIGAITSTLKMMAREFHVPVLLLSQLNRQIEYRGGEPHLSDLRESGRIEEDSDVVVLLWRMDKEDSLGNLVKGKIEKNRQGPTGELPISFNASSFRFSEKYQAAASNNGVAEDDLIPIEDSLAGIYHKNEAERVAVDG
jgi:replicative DNA helicase